MGVRGRGLVVWSGGLGMGLRVGVRGFGDKDQRSRVGISGFRDFDLGFRVQGSGFRI